MRHINKLPVFKHSVPSEILLLQHSAMTNTIKLYKGLSQSQEILRHLVNGCDHLRSRAKSTLRDN